MRLVTTRVELQVEMDDGLARVFQIITRLDCCCTSTASLTPILFRIISETFSPLPPYLSPSPTPPSLPPFLYSYIHEMFT